MAWQAGTPGLSFFFLLLLFQGNQLVPILRKLSTQLEKALGRA